MKILKVEDAAEFLGLSKDSIYKMAESGKLSAAKLGPDNGKEWRFTDESIEADIREEIRLQTAKRRNGLDKLKDQEKPSEPEKAAPPRAGRRRRPAPPPSLGVGSW